MSPTLRGLFRRFSQLLLVAALVCSCSDRRLTSKFALEPEGWIGGEGKLGAKVTVIDFWATWCAPCLKGMPELIEWQNKYGSKGLRVIGVAAAEAGETPETIRGSLQKFLTENFPALNFPIAYDSSGKLAEKWKIEALPTQFVLSASGDIVFIGRGSEVEEAMLKQLGLPPPPKKEAEAPTTKP